MMPELLYFAFFDTAVIITEGVPVVLLTNIELDELYADIFTVT